MRLLGVDLGDRRIGLALGETETGIARGLETLTRRSAVEDRARVAHLIEQHAVGGFVVGLPRNTDGSEGPQATATRSWVAAVLEPLGLPVELRDEAWSTQAAEANLGRPPRGRSGGPPSAATRERRRRAVDREAARLILQAVLDAR